MSFKIQLPKKQKSVLVQVRVPKELKDQAKAVLKTGHGISIGKFIRICLESLLKGEIK